MSLTKNTIYSLITFGFRILSGTILMFIFGRKLTVADFGNFNYALSFATIVLVILGYGYNTYLIREISQKKCALGEAFINTVIPKIAITLLSFIGIFLYLKINKLSDTTNKIVWILSIGAVGNSLGQYFNALQKGKDFFRSETMVSIIQNSLICVLSLLAIFYLRANIYVIGIIYFVSYFIGALIAFSFLFKVHSKDLGFGNFSLRKNLIFFKEALPFAAATVFILLYFQIDTLIIGNYLGANSVAQYQSVMKLVYVCMLVPEILFNSFYPTISATFANGKNNNYESCYKLVSLLMIVAVGISIFTLIFPEFIMSIVYNNKYNNAAHILFLFSFVILIRYAAMSYGIIVVASRHQNLQLISSIVATCISLFLNLILTPKFGVEMAIMVSFCVNLFIFIFYFFNMYRIYKISFLDKKILYQSFPLFAIAILAFVLKLYSAYISFAFTCLLTLGYAIKLFRESKLHKKLFSLFKEYNMSL